MATKAFSFLSVLFRSTLGVICQASSVIGLIVLFVDKPWAVYVALSFVCLSLILFVVAFLYLVSKRAENKYPEGFKRIASFCFYRTEDCENITCTTKRIIQSKSLCLSEIEHKFKWTGRRLPEVTAGKHKVVSKVTANNSGDYDFDVAKIKLAEPLLYDESSVICVKTVVNDSDQVSKPFLGTMVEHPVGHLVFSILLGYKPDSFTEPATLHRKKLKCDLAEFEFVEEIPFDTKHKRYYAEYENPEIGYLYKIEWKR
ncbi:hypothetical protein [Fibrobacter sp.]|uniref:hypothetical protein n=1 Tax=Fibrobacter sp. TaxID=35828 RepID=UPI0038684A32